MGRSPVTLTHPFKKRSVIPNKFRTMSRIAPFAGIVRWMDRTRRPSSLVKVMVTSFGFALRLVMPRTLRYFAALKGPSTTFGKLILVAGNEDGTALATAHDGPAMKSRTITVAAKG